MSKPRIPKHLAWLAQWDSSSRSRSSDPLEEHRSLETYFLRVCARRQAAATGLRPVNTCWVPSSPSGWHFVPRHREEWLRNFLREDGSNVNDNGCVERRERVCFFSPGCNWMRQDNVIFVSFVFSFVLLRFQRRWRFLWVKARRKNTMKTKRFSRLSSTSTPHVYNSEFLSSWVRVQEKAKAKRKNNWKRARSKFHPYRSVSLIGWVIIDQSVSRSLLQAAMVSSLRLTTTWKVSTWTCWSSSTNRKKLVDGSLNGNGPRWSPCPMQSWRSSWPLWSTDIPNVTMSRIHLFPRPSKVLKFERRGRNKSLEPNKR